MGQDVLGCPLEKELGRKISMVTFRSLENNGPPGAVRAIEDPSEMENQSGFLESIHMHLWTQVRVGAWED